MQLFVLVEIKTTTFLSKIYKTHFTIWSSEKTTKVHSDFSCAKLCFGSDFFFRIYFLYVILT